VYEQPVERGPGFVTASVVDPFGNILGVMHNAHYLEISEHWRGMTVLDHDGPPLDPVAAGRLVRGWPPIRTSASRRSTTRRRAVRCGCPGLSRPAALFLNKVAVNSLCEDV
jgi:hypothetical protein